MRRVHGWSFRLQKEADRSDSALFVTLTYSNEHVPLTNKKFMTLQKRDIQLFFKRLRKLTDEYSKNPLRKKIRYYCAGEYGPNTYRPHYHLIIFNAEEEIIEKAWTLGNIHYGQLTPASAAYTLKYISKDSTIHFNGDDREKEFSLMSKRLGNNYLNEEMINWHRQKNQDSITERYYLPIENYKVALPRYYKDKIWNKFERELIGLQFVTYMEEQFDKKTYQEKLDSFAENDQLREYYSEKNRDVRDTKI